MTSNPVTTTFVLTDVRPPTLRAWYADAQVGAVAELTRDDCREAVRLVRLREGVRWEEAGLPGETMGLDDALLRVLWTAHPPGRQIP